MAGRTPYRVLYFVGQSLDVSTKMLPGRAQIDGGCLRIVGSSELLYELLIDQVNDEAAYQAFFLKHPIVFSALGYDSAAPFDKQSKNKLPVDEGRGYRPEPDFLCADLRSAVLTVFELKTPFEPNPTTSRADGNRRKFRATVESHLSQATEYVESIREREAARQIVCDVLGLPSISSYRVVMPYGLASADDAPNVARLADSRKTTTEILPYDSLLELLAQCHAFGRPGTSEPGWCFVLHIELPQDQVNPKAYIVDFGSPGQDRASIFVENGGLVFEVVDSTGTSYRLQHCAFKTGVPIYLRWEFSTEPRAMLVSCDIGNEEVDFRQATQPIEVSLTLGALLVGCDLAANNRGHFKLLAHYIVPRTLNIGERLGTFHYFKRQTIASPHYLEFDGTSAMKRREDGDLIAIDDASRPRDSIGRLIRRLKSAIPPHRSRGSCGTG